MAESKSGAQSQNSANLVDKYRRVFQRYFATLCDVIPTDQMLPRLVSSEVITMDEMDEIEAKETSLAKARTLLRGPVWRSVNGGYPDTFVRLLCVMRSLRVRSCEKLSEEICNNLDISNEEVSELTREW